MEHVTLDRIKKPVIYSWDGTINPEKIISTGAYYYYRISEDVLTTDMLKNGFIYQPADFSNPISSLIPSKTIEAKNIKYFLKNSFGFGGNNISVLIKTNMSDDSGEKEE